MKTGLSKTALGKREYGRRYAALQRDRKWAAEAMNRERCPRFLSRGLRCRALLHSRVVHGETVPFCPRCDRKRKGLCVDCGKAPVNGRVGYAVRCAGCQRLALLTNTQRYQERHPDRIKRAWVARKRRLECDPAAKTESSERKRLWRLANPAKKRRYAEAWAKSERCAAYMKAYRERNRLARLEKQKERDRLSKLGIVFTHPCVSCGTELVGRQKKCARCRGEHYQHARSVLLGVAA